MESTGVMQVAQEVPGAPLVLAQIVNDMDPDDSGDGHIPEDGMLLAEGGDSSTFIPPIAPPLTVIPDGIGGFHVRLTLSVGAGGASIAPGLEIDDCGLCPFCLDKPKYGGPGTKRQKCELKQQEASFAADNLEPHIWAKLHLITQHEMEQMKRIAELPLPEPLVKAMDVGPLPLVWAYRRKRRARTLPPAYVLMYYCEDRVPLDRSQLSLSRQRYFKNSRSDLTTDVSARSKAARRPRVPRERPGLTMYTAGQEDPAMQQLRMASTQMADPNLGTSAHWRGEASDPGGGFVVHGQLAQSPQHMYALQPQPGQSYMHHVPMPQPGLPMYQQQQMYHSSHQQIVYRQQQQQPHSMVPGQQDMYDTMSRGPGPASQAGQAHMDDGIVGEPMTHDYYTAPPDQQYYSLPPGQPHPMEMSHMGMEEETNSWIDDPGVAPGEQSDIGGRATKRHKPRKAAAPVPPPQAASAPEDETSSAMSNKTLELMLGRLQGQLPPQTYEKVISLVRDVQCRRMSLSRSEFLQHFQAICAGNPKPR